MNGHLYSPHALTRRRARPQETKQVRPLCSHQFAVPPQNRIRSHDRGHLLEHLPPEGLAFDGQAPALAVVKEDSPLPELLSEHAILSSKVLDSVLLSMIDPAGQNQEQKLPELEKGFHISPNAV